MIKQKKFLSALELQAEVDSWSDDEQCGGHADKINIVITPPDRVDVISDSEELDENMQIINDANEFPNELAGNFEVQYFFGDCNSKVEESAVDDISLRPSTSKEALQKTDEYQKPKWSRRQNYQFSNSPIDNTANTHKNLYEKIGSLSPLQLWECFIDIEVLQLIVDSTNEYAAQKNNLDFFTTIDEIKTFLGILCISGYHTFPNIHSYWSAHGTLGCEYIQKSMSRDRFKQIKSYFHVCDNKNLRANDKFAKVSPLNDILNKNEELLISYLTQITIFWLFAGMTIRW